jgi:hypothetical protein
LVQLDEIRFIKLDLFVKWGASSLNVGMNVFMMLLFANAEVAKVVKSDVLSRPSLVQQIIQVELLIISVALAAAFLFQTRSRDLI